MADAVHFSRTMRTGVHAGFAIALAITGCAVDEEELELSTAEQMLGGHNGGLPSGIPVLNSFGFSTTVSTAPHGRIDLDNPFFQDLGTNDRRCVSCHLPTAGWSVTPEQLQIAFVLTRGGQFDDGLGIGAIFRPNDGTNSPNADVSTYKARRSAYSMLLTRGTIRVGLPMPQGAEFDLVAVDDPYGFASAAELSMFRRPLPSTNLTLLPAAAAGPNVMWDGRVTGATVNAALADQSNGATMGHAQRQTPLPQDVREQIVGLETSLFTAQQHTNRMGTLTAEGAKGGADAVSKQTLVASRFNLFDSWAASTNAQRRAAFRGQELFNTRIRVGTTAGTCRACHSAENSGTNANGAFFNVGTADVERRSPDQPLYTFKNKTTLEEMSTTDPGRALITGKWSDMKRFKTPSLRGLAARAPYFHGGSAKTLLDVVKLYEEELNFVFTEEEEKDLVAFMSAL